MISLDLKEEKCVDLDNCWVGLAGNLYVGKDNSQMSISCIYIGKKEEIEKALSHFGGLDTLMYPILEDMRGERNYGLEFTVLGTKYKL